MQLFLVGLGPQAGMGHISRFENSLFRPMGEFKAGPH
jgi:hypothetical protein